MIIDYIQLDNFLSHNDSKITFEKGINVIYGKNGAGKSSIIDAIRFALFGEKRGNSIAELIRTGARECSVTIGFRLNDRYYEVFRSQKLGKSGNISDRRSWIKVDGVVSAETAEGVIKEIQSGLRIDKDIFLNSVFVRQGEMDALISEVQSKREELFSRIIGINVLNENAKALKSIIDEVKLAGAQFSDLDGRIDENEKKTRDYISEKEEHERNFRSLQEREKTSVEALSISERARDEAIRKKSDYDNLRKRIGELSTNIKTLKEKVSGDETRLNSISFSPEEKGRIEMDPLFMHREEITEFFRLNNDMKNIRVNLENTEKKIKEYDEDFARLSALEDGHRKHEDSEKRISELDVEIRGKQQSRALRDTLNEDLARERGELEKLVHLMDSPIYSSIRGMDREKASAKAAELDGKLREIDGDRRELKTKVGNINGLREELRGNRETLGENNRCPVCGTELDSLHLQEIHSSYEQKDREYLEEIEQIKSRLLELGKSYTEIETALSSLRGKDADVYLKAVDESQRLKESISGKEEKLESLKSAVEDLENLEKELSEAKKVRDSLAESEKTYTSLLYATRRASIDDLRRESEALEQQIKEKASGLSDISSKIGFEPKDEDHPRMEALARKYNAIRDRESEYYRIKSELESGRRSLGDMENEMAEKGKTLSQMGDVEAELASAAEKYNTAHSEYSRLKSEAAAMSERISNVNSNIARLEEEKRKLENDRGKQIRIREAITKLEKLRSAFGRDGIQALIRKDSSASINNMARNYLSSFNFEFDDVRIDENFNIKVISNGAEEPLDSLSGGERISLAIAVRLAIAKYLTGRVSTVIMDEPTNFLDEDRRNSLKDIIRYSLADEGMVQQMIMITHHSELTSAADSSYEIVKSGGVSKITQG